jgi:hypothetical protein
VYIIGEQGACSGRSSDRCIRRGPSWSR